MPKSKFKIVPIGKKADPKFKKGQKVRVPRWLHDPATNRSKRMPDDIGTIVNINGAYHYVQIGKDPRDVLELYPTEIFPITSPEEEGRLTMATHIRQDQEGIDFQLLQQQMEEVKKKEEKTVKILDMLEIPHSSATMNGSDVHGIELVKILMDEKKMKTIMSKIRNKAFW